MILLFYYYCLNSIKRRHIEEVSQFVLKKYFILFISPTAVSIMESVGYLQGYMWQFALICIVSGIAYFFGNSIYRNWCYETSGKNYGE